MFLTNIELEARMDESVDDITAAEMAPRPRKATKGGVRNWMTAGRTIPGVSYGSVLFRLMSVNVQSKRKIA